MRRTAGVAVFLIAGLNLSTAFAADYAGHVSPRFHARGLRGYIGECVRTRVLAIGAPVTMPNQPPALVYSDGVVQAYDAGMLGQSETRPGDPIQLCLVSFSRDCDGDELPGRTYATGNLRTGAGWTQPDIRSSCRAR